MPVANPDFSAFVQRAKDVNPEAIFIFVPGGAQPAAIGKALAERGIDTDQDQGDGQGETDRGEALQEHGRRRARHHHGRSTTTTATSRQMNKEFVEGLQRGIRAQSGHLLDRRL